MLNRRMLCFTVSLMMIAAVSSYGLTPVSYRNVTLTSGFWADRVKIAEEKTVWQEIRQCEITGRIRNFERAAAGEHGKFEGFFFNDSDVYKVLEGAAYCLGNHRNAKLEAKCDEIIAKIAAAQLPSGYLYTFYQIRGELDKAFTNEKDNHETYCAGHLIEAAVAYYDATGKRNLLDVAIKLADHLDQVFGPGRRHDAPGHEEIELALFKLWHTTGEERYEKLAEFFLEQRGHTDGRKSNGWYDQDHLPIREQHEARGHSVRACYLYSAMTDLAGVRKDESLEKALDDIWSDIVSRKMYITGGIGAIGKIEGFGQPYDLPNESAYAETCAAIAMGMWNQRMAVHRGDAKFADMVEREMYNGILAGWSIDGEHYFYVNPLASAGNHHRDPWFACACCPPNVLRWVASIGGTIYATENDVLYVNQYMASDAKVDVAGQTIGIKQETNYPWDGKIRFTFEMKSPVELVINLRAPGWCEGARAVPASGGLVANARTRSGYLSMYRKWTNGDVLELELPMSVRAVKADPHVVADEGKVALMRGPVVYCAEAADNAAIVLPKDGEFSATFDKDLLSGMSVIHNGDFTAVPYFAWDNRKAGPMAVWVGYP